MEPRIRDTRGGTLRDVSRCLALCLEANSVACRAGTLPEQGSFSTGIGVNLQAHSIYGEGCSVGAVHDLTLLNSFSFFKKKFSRFAVLSLFSPLIFSRFLKLQK